MNILHPWLDWYERNTGNDDGIQFEQNDPALINSRGKKTQDKFMSCPI